MSSKDKNSIYKVGIVIFIIIILTWLEKILSFTNKSIQVPELTAALIPALISILAIGLYFKMWFIIYKKNKIAKIPRERYRSLYCQAQIGLITTTLDGSKILMANPKMLEMLGYSDNNEFQQLSAYNLWVNPSDRLEFVNQLQANGKVSAFSFAGLYKDGRVKEFELYAIYDSKSGHIEANIIDVTEKKVFEKYLLYQAALLKNIQESILVINMEGEVQFYNQKAQRLFNIEGNRLGEGMFSEINADAEKYAEANACIIKGESWQGQNSMVINGEKRIFRHRVDPIIEENQTNGCLVISTDITELVKSREQAEGANLAKSQFLANMSHEIRTPMIGILGAVDLLEQNNLDSKQLANINIIRDCGEDLLKTINEILDVSKIEIGLATLNPENCNIYDLFYKTIKIVEPTLIEKGLGLELDLHSISSLEAFVDPHKLRQILTNILFNAIKFTSQGTIKLKSYVNYQENQNQLVISVIDTGIGIPQEYLPYIFDSFSQGDTSTSRGYGGTGLGLYICDKLVEIMGGTIEIISEIGQGTEFIIKIPLTIATNASKSKERVNNINKLPPIQFIPRSILVVEDNELNQKIVCEMLRNYGFEVSTAKNGLECLQILQYKTFDAILLDMQMPLMDGYETARLIQEDKTLNHIPLIAMTAHAMNGDREKCLASGCTSYIAKPFKSEELVNEITQHFNYNYSSPRNLNQYNNLFINELIPEFIIMLADMIKALDQAISSNNIEEIKSISHDIKGTSGMYGFNMISHTAAQIEKAVYDKSPAELHSLRKQLNELYLEASEQVS